MTEEIITRSRPSEEPPKQKSTGHRRANTNSKFEKTTATTKDIDACLTSVYQNSNGVIPDMKKIDIKKHNPVVRFFARLLTMGIIFAIGAWVVWYFVPNLSEKKDTVAQIKIAGPDRLSLGESAAYTITYKNNDNAPLKDVTLQVHYPDGFVVENTSLAPSNVKKSEWSLGTLAPHQTQTITIVGALYAPLETEESWRAYLNYRPANFNSPLQTMAIFTASLTHSPYSVSLNGPTESVVGNIEYYRLKLNTSNSWPSGIFELAPEWPKNFLLATSSPALNKNNRWLISTGESQKGVTAISPTSTELSFTLGGTWSDASNPSSTINVALLVPMGAQADLRSPVAQATIPTLLTKNSLALNLAINGALTDFDTKPAETLNATLRVKNTTGADIKNVTAQLVFDAPAIKKQSLLNWPELHDVHDGDVVGKQLNANRRQGSITWTAKHVPELARLKPGAEVALNLTLPLRDNKSIALESLTEATINVADSVTFTDTAGAIQTIAGNQLTITVNSDLSFEPRADITDEQGKKHYTVTWVLNNSYHALKNIELSASLYGDALWQAGAEASSGKLMFEAKDKKITWQIPELPTTMDVASAPFSIILNSQNPTQNLLLSKVHLRAEDLATGKIIELVGDPIAL